MNRNVWPVAAVLGGITAALAAARPAPAAAPAGVGLAVVKTFRLGGSDRWDYVTVDPELTTQRKRPASSGHQP